MLDERDIQISDVAISLEPGSADIPLQPLVHGLRVRLTPAALTKLAEQAVAMASAKAPVDVSLTGCRLVDGTIEISARAGMGFMGADVTARLAISATGGDELRVAVADLDAPRWLPVAPMIEKAIAKASENPGVRPDSSGKAILLNPAEYLARKGLPARLAPGAWEVAVTPAALDLEYRGHRDQQNAT